MGLQWLVGRPHTRTLAADATRALVRQRDTGRAECESRQCCFQEPQIAGAPRCHAPTVDNTTATVRIADVPPSTCFKVRRRYAASRKALLRPHLDAPGSATPTACFVVAGDAHAGIGAGGACMQRQGGRHHSESRPTEAWGWHGERSLVTGDPLFPADDGIGRAAIPLTALRRYYRAVYVYRVLKSQTVC